MAASDKRGSLQSSTLTWTSVGLTWQMVQRTQTIVHREAECPIEDDPPAFGGYRGGKRAFWQFGRPTM